MSEIRAPEAPGAEILTPIGIAERPVPGPPKRFAQGIGATLSMGALIAALAGA